MKKKVEKSVVSKKKPKFRLSGDILYLETPIWTCQPISSSSSIHNPIYGTDRSPEALGKSLYTYIGQIVPQMLLAGGGPLRGPGKEVGPLRGPPRTNTSSPTSTMFTLAVPAWYVWTERRKPWNRLLPLFVFADWAYLWVSVFVLAHLLLLGQRICSCPPTSAGSAYLFFPTHFCWVSVFVLPLHFIR